MGWQAVSFLWSVAWPNGDNQEYCSAASFIVVWIRYQWSTTMANATKNYAPPCAPYHNLLLGIWPQPPAYSGLAQHVLVGGTLYKVVAVKRGRRPLLPATPFQQIRVAASLTIKNHAFDEPLMKKINSCLKNNDTITLKTSLARP